MQMVQLCCKWNEARKLVCAYVITILILDCIVLYAYIPNENGNANENGNKTRWKWQEKRNGFQENQNVDSIQSCKRRSAQTKVIIAKRFTEIFFLFCGPIFRLFLILLNDFYLCVFLFLNGIAAVVAAAAITTNFIVIIAVSFCQEFDTVVVKCLQKAANKCTFFGDFRNFICWQTCTIVSTYIFYMYMHNCIWSLSRSLPQWMCVAQYTHTLCGIWFIRFAYFTPVIQSFCSFWELDSCR